MPSTRSRPHPLVTSHLATVLLVGLAGAIALGFTSFFGSWIIYAGAFAVALVATRLFYVARIRPSLRDEPAPKFRALLPTLLGSTSLVVYAVVVGVVHSHAFAVRSSEATRLSEQRARLVRADLARVGAAEKQLGRVGLSRQQQAHIGAQLNQLFKREIADERAFIAIRLPRVTDFPSWFTKLRDVMALCAQILAALTIALVFSRRRTDDRSVNALLRPAALFALIGLAAALVGTAPSLPANVQAFLLGFVIAGLVTSATTVGLVAADLV